MNSEKRSFQRVILAGLVLIPLFFALAATPVLLLWIMSASAFSPDSDGFYYNLGFFALLLYMAAYAILGLAQAVASAFKWQVVSCLHWVIWLCLAVFLGTMLYALSGLGVL